MLFQLVFAFLLFMVLVASIHSLNRAAFDRYGYEPFAPPNAALMCIPSLLLLSVASALPSLAALGTPEPVVVVKLLIWALFLVSMFALLSWRTNRWIAGIAALILALAAPVVLLTVLFQRLSR
jgi:hypothetical protein